LPVKSDKACRSRETFRNDGGDKVEFGYQEIMYRESFQRSRPILRIKDLIMMNDLEALAVKEINLELYIAKILGIAGVKGKGQAELVEAITGLRKVLSGKVMLGDVDITNRSP